MPDPSSMLALMGNPLALLGFLLLLPLIILYLLKPKPKHVFFPSIMFIKRIEKTKRFSSILKKFIRDPLLLIQIIIICLLVLAAANPRHKAMEDVDVVEHVVFVVDASASMKSSDVKPTRFAKAIDTVERVIGDLDSEDRTSIVLAESTPILAAHKVRGEDALGTLSKLSCADTPSNIGDALLYSIDLVSKVNVAPKIVVVSDLSGQRGINPQVASKRALNQNISVVFYDVGGGGDNLAITSIIAERLQSQKTTAFIGFTISNYGRARKTAAARILVDGAKIKDLEAVVDAGESELLSARIGLDYGEHNITVELSGGGALSIDDVAYAVVPQAEAKRVLFMSNGEYGNQYIKYALESSEHTVVESHPPVIPQTTGFDAVVLGRFEEDNILPGTFEGVKKLVSEGGALLISASAILPYAKNDILSELSPVTYEGVVERTAFVRREVNHEIVDEREVSFTETVLEKYLLVKPKEGAKTILATKGGSPLMVYHNFGRGKVIYVGVSSNPEWSNFYYTSSYPILWMRSIDFATATVGELGVKSFSTGDFIPKVENATITTPSGKRVASTNLLLDEVGVYGITTAYSTQYFAVNLADPVESNTTRVHDKPGSDVKKNYAGAEKQEVLKDNFRLLASIALLVMLFEAFYLRGRGYYGR